MASYSEGQGFIFINNNSTDITWLNRARLYLRKKTTVNSHLIESMKSIWLDAMHTA